MSSVWDEFQISRQQLDIQRYLEASLYVISVLWWLLKTTVAELIQVCNKEGGRWLRMHSLKNTDMEGIVRGRGAIKEWLEVGTKQSLVSGTFEKSSPHVK